MPARRPFSHPVCPPAPLLRLPTLSGEDKEVNGKLLASAQVGETQWQDTVKKMQNGLLEENSKVPTPAATPAASSRFDCNQAIDV